MPRNFIDEILDDVPKYTLRNNEGDVINDNVDIALKTPVVQEGTPLSKSFFDELFTYEETTYKRIDHSTQEEVTQTLTFALPAFADNSNDIEGTGNSKLYNGNSTASTTPTMTMHTNADNGFTLSDGSGSETFVAVSANSSEQTDISYINNVLARTSYSSSYYLNLSGGVAKRFDFDLKAAKKVTFNIRFASGYIGETATFSGSNNGTSFTTISTFAKDTNISIESTTAYRYYRVAFGGTAGYHEIYYMYFQVNDTKKIPSYENALTTTEEVLPEKEIIIKTQNMGVSNVTSTTLNGYPVDYSLKANERYILVFDGSKFITINKPPIKGSANLNASPTTGYIAKIDLGASAKFVLANKAGNSAENYGTQIVNPGTKQYLHASVYANLSSDGKTLTFRNNLTTGGVGIHYIAFF